MRSRNVLPIVAALLLAAGCATTPSPPAGESEADAVAAAPFNELGNVDAPVLIIEFSDLQCSFCARHASQTFPELRRNYIDTGKLRYAVRDLPLPMHRHAVPAAVAARCAGEQGKFWEMRQAIYLARGRLDQEPYAGMAGEFGLDVERFEACRRDGRQLAKVQADAALAGGEGIASTPAFVIGRIVGDEFQGETIVGAKPYAVFAAKIESLLGEPR
jgi:protein-disulfide isomerase